MKITNCGWGLYEVEDHGEVAVCKYSRGMKAGDGRFHPTWKITRGKTTMVGEWGKEEALRVAGELLTRPSTLPLTREEMISQMFTEKRVSGIVPVTLAEICEGDQDALLDTLSLRLTGTVLLMDITYTIAGHEENTLFLYVTGIILLED